MRVRDNEQGLDLDWMKQSTTLPRKDINRVNDINRETMKSRKHSDQHNIYAQ